METNSPNPIFSSSTHDEWQAEVTNDLRALAHDAEEFLNATAGEVGDRLSGPAREARDRLTRSLELARTTFRKLQERTAATAAATNRLIRRRPYESIGVAFGVGVLCGVLTSRR